MLKIWDTKTNELIRTLTGHLSEISDLVVMNNGFLGNYKIFDFKYFSFYQSECIFKLAARGTIQ
jgi:hypothetical protein